MKKSCKVFTALLSSAFLISALAGCGDDGTKLLEENLIDDAYDNYYEICVYSFNDSDGDGVGDLKGVTEKLDYVRDLGYTGIWLMPICPSPSYHKYNVTDYKNVDPEYGTLEDFDELVTAAHEKGIKLITDLVVNHSSSLHPWFTEFKKARSNNDESNQYYDYYNYSSEFRTGYTYFTGGYYESRFESGMPDLNLDSPKVREEISSIMDFWLTDHKVDGFRLDACTSYYTNSTSKSADFAGWIKEEAVKYNPNAYIVGEVWSDAGTIGKFYGSGADSFFCFPAEGSSGYINSAVNLSTTIGNGASAANSFYKSVETVVSMANGYIPAPFISNHDTGRAAGFLMRDPVRIKFAYGLLSLYSGNVFNYYGNEVGMRGSSNDPDKRVGILWTADTKPIYPSGVSSKDPETFYPFPSVEEQLADENSILNYFKLCNNARNAFPALMRGSSERIEQSVEDVLVFKKTYGEETIVIAVNFAQEERTIEGEYGTLKQSLICTEEGEIKSSGNKTTMPAFSIAIFA
ncbi:MAG: alpha amylase [Clostridiales bacterium]|nr:alpha amylase [Clostridiales bacterium]